MIEAETIIKAALVEEELEKKKRKEQKEQQGKQHESRFFCTQTRCNIDNLEQYVSTTHRPRLFSSTTN
jgi:hypothetical protein